MWFSEKNIVQEYFIPEQLQVTKLVVSHIFMNWGFNEEMFDFNLLCNLLFVLVSKIVKKKKLEYFMENGPASFA